MSLDLITFLSLALPEGTGIYGIRTIPSGDGFHFEVELDGLNDPAGAVSLDTCTEVSHRLVEIIDGALEKGERVTSGLPEGLNQENYSLEVSSAGAERKLRLPEDLERFKALPLKIKYDREGTIESELVLFRAFLEGGRIQFERYQPKRKKAGQRSMARKAIREPLILESSSILEGNLYLDY